MTILLKRTFMLLPFLLILFSQHANASHLNLTKQLFKSEQNPTVKRLIQTSDLVIYGSSNATYTKYDTNKWKDGKHLYNYVQPISVNKAYKGHAENQVNVVTTGVEPLPKRDDPINKLFPGPLADGNYIIFLKQIKNTEFYQLNGGWQGMYPYINGQLISLEQAGFNIFHGLTLSQFQKKLNEIKES